MRYVALTVATLERAGGLEGGGRILNIFFRDGSHCRVLLIYTTTDSSILPSLGLVYYVVMLSRLNIILFSLIITPCSFQPRKSRDVRCHAPEPVSLGRICPPCA